MLLHGCAITYLTEVLWSDVWLAFSMIINSAVVDILVLWRVVILAFDSWQWNCRIQGYAKFQDF